MDDCEDDELPVGPHRLPGPQLASTQSAHCCDEGSAHCDEQAAQTDRCDDDEPDRVLLLYEEELPPPHAAWHRESGVYAIVPLGQYT